MLRIVSLFLLLIISRISFADTIPATPLDKQQSALSACKSITYTDVTDAIGGSGGSIISVSVFNIPNAFQVMCSVSYSIMKWGKLESSSVKLIRNYVTLYTCPSGYTQSNSSGNPDSSGAFCTKLDEPVDKTCAELAADGSSELGSGYFVAGHASTYCYQANPTHICQITNNGESIYFGKVSDTCSIGMGGGSYWSYTGSDCTSVGPSVNYYKTSQAASLACNPTLPDGASSADSTAPDVPDTDTPPPCPYGSGSITNGPETMTVCLDAPLSSPTSSSTPTSDSSSDGDTPSTDNSTPSTDNSTTTNNTTTNNTSTSNNSSSTSNSTSNNTSTTNNDNSTTNTSGGSSGSSSGAATSGASGTGGDGTATSGASGTGGDGTATSGASGTGGDDGEGDSVSGADDTFNGDAALNALNELSNDKDYYRDLIENPTSLPEGVGGEGGMSLNSLWYWPTGSCSDISYQIDMGSGMSGTINTTAFCVYWNSVANPIISWFLYICTGLYLFYLWDRTLADATKGG